MKKLLLTFVAMFALASAWAIEQDADGNYLIGSVDDWKAFAEIVNNTPGVNAIMTDDVDLGDDQTMIGVKSESASGPAFSGVFDGQGHTLKIAYTEIGSNQVGAPFAKVNGATIKNLHVTGTLSSAGFHPTSIISDSWGTTTLEKVWGDVAITGTRTGWVEASGLVGCMKAGNLTVTDCLFTGSVNCSGSYNGCFIGYIDRGSATITNCLSTGTFQMGGSNGLRGTHTNCFIKEFPTTIPENMQCTDEQLADGTIATALQAGRDEEVWIQGENGPKLAIFNDYIRQDADGYYLIRTADHWKEFAEIVNTTPNANARMIADVDLGDDQTMIGSGTSDNSTGAGNVKFQGVFDGQGHSLTINYSVAEIFVAPFRHIQNATIKNLHVKGKISTSNRYAGGIVAACFGNHINSYISNCRSSVEIVSDYVNTGDFYGGAWHGGIAARLYYYGQLNITDCLFDGHISGESKGVVWGGMMGMPDGTVSFKNCLQVGTLEAEGVIGGGNGSGTFSTRFSNGYASFINVDNCYYRTVFGNAQGTQATDEQLADGTITKALQGDRTVRTWVQYGDTPMLKIFAKLWGDLNDDGIVDVADVNLAIDIVLGKDSNDNYSGRADLNDDGIVDVTDVNTLINIILGKD